MDATLAQILNELYRITGERDELMRVGGAYRKRILELEKALGLKGAVSPQQPETD